jgi:NADPH:quinone reductase-like Zn-dependent oxidoreductase
MASVIPQMMASRIHEFGPPEVIGFEKIARPEPGRGEVRVRVKAAGVGPWDAWIRAGKSVLPQPLPLTLGSDLSGVIDTVGPGVTGLAPGMEVFGVTNRRFTGAYAEYALMHADMIAQKPATLDHIAAASVPVIAVTAWQMLFEYAHVASGQSVLILGAAGNVGAYAVQFAKREGARVIAVAGSKDLEDVRALGANQAIEARAVRFEEVVEPVDAVIDTVGGDTQQRSFSVLRPGGILVSAVSEPDAQEAARRNVRALFMLVQVTSARLARIAEMIDAGILKTRIGTVLPHAEARRAHQMLEGVLSRPRGKIVLQVGE